MKRKFSDPVSTQSQEGGGGYDLRETKAAPVSVGEAPNTEDVSTRGGESSPPVAEQPKLVVDAASHVTHKNLVVEPEGTASPTHPNQDRIKIRLGNEIYNEKQLPSKDFKKQLDSIFVVCDGHGTNGEVAAEFFTSYLTNAIEDAFFHLETSSNIENITLDQLKSNAKDILCRVFVEADNAYRNEGLPSVSKKGTMRSGGAATTVAVVFSHFVILANAGDSRAIIVARSKDLKNKIGEESAGLQVVLTTKDHSLQSDDAQRAMDNGGREAKGGDYVQVGSHCLNMTRSLGDFDFKQNPDSPIVSPIPTVRVIDSKDVLAMHSDETRYLYLIAASDGLWDFVVREEILNKIEADEGYDRVPMVENLAVCRAISGAINSDGAIDTSKATKQITEVVRQESHGHPLRGGAIHYDDFSVLVTGIVVDKQQ